MTHPPGQPSGQGFPIVKCKHRDGGLIPAGLSSVAPILIPGDGGGQAQPVGGIRPVKKQRIPFTCSHCHHRSSFDPTAEGLRKRIHLQEDRHGAGDVIAYFPRCSHCGTETKVPPSARKAANGNAHSGGERTAAMSARRKTPAAKTPRPGRSKPIRVKVVIHEAEEGGYWAEVPALPGCITEGDTKAELLKNLREAVEGCLLVIPGNFDPAEKGGKTEEVAL
jgi:hypothetical protein